MMRELVDRLVIEVEARVECENKMLEARSALADERATSLGLRNEKDDLLSRIYAQEGTIETIRHELEFEKKIRTTDLAGYMDLAQKAKDLNLEVGGLLRDLQDLWDRSHGKSDGVTNRALRKVVEDHLLPLMRTKKAFAEKLSDIEIPF